MKKIAYFDCYSGASGDLLLGALLDNAINFNWLKEELNKVNLPPEKYEITKDYVLRNCINSCKINIKLLEKEHHHRNLNDILTIIQTSKIAEKAKNLAISIFKTLAEAESKIHQTTLDKIHFHEVGAVDAIIDIIGFSICYTSLNIDKTIVSPIPVGHGQVLCHHGLIPIPAPAVLEIIKNKKITIRNNPKIKEECFTPTAAAILSTIIDTSSYMPDMDQVESIGYGAGDKTFEYTLVSNLRLVIGFKN